MHARAYSSFPYRYLLLTCVVLLGMSRVHGQPLTLLQPTTHAVTLHREEASHGNLRILLAVLNDNYTGSVERGKEGRYLGPDDFLTVASLLQVYWADYRLSMAMKVVTSRKYEFRYDLALVGISSTFGRGNYVIRPELGLIGKGNYGGEKIQNAFHRRQDLPEILLPYSGEGFGLFAASTLSRPIQLTGSLESLLTPAVELQLFSGLMPSRLSTYMSYQAHVWPGQVQCQLLGGARFYLNTIEGYSELVRSGLFFGMSAKVRIYEQCYVDLGLSFFPAQNLENDPLYEDKDHAYLPQFTLVLSWNSPWQGLYSYLEH